MSHGLLFFTYNSKDIHLKIMIDSIAGIIIARISNASVCRIS